MEDNFFISPKYKNWIDRVIEETKTFDRIIKGVYNSTAKEVYGSSSPEIAVFAYGSPGRIELIGGDSDADIFIAERERTPQSEKLKKLLKERWAKFDFSKVDTPTWSTYKDIDIYLTKSLVEGNQILETRFLIGDETIARDIETKKQHFDSIERELQNIIFNKLYFNQYFKQRVRDGNINIKYCSGGSRDFLFFYWNNRLNQKRKKEKELGLYVPQVKQGLQRLLEEGKISDRELIDTLDAIGFSMSIRSDILKINKEGVDRGLTFLDDGTLNRLQTLGYPPPELTRKTFNECRNIVKNISKIVWEEVIKTAGTIRGLEWERNFRLAYDFRTSESVRSQISSDDSLMSIALIWGASDSSQENLFNILAEKYKKSTNWAIIGSIVCSPLCSSEILHHFGTEQLKEKGYGYLLRVVARNKNVKKETLESIAEDPKLEKRYTEVAKIALKGGTDLANNQI